MSGLEAVKRIVETEAEARRLVDDAKTHAQQIIARANEEAKMLREEAVSSAQKEREELLQAAKQKAEAEARQSDIETDQLLSNYQQLAGAKSNSAADKAIDLIVNA